MIKWLIEFVSKVWKKIEDVLANYLAHIIIAAILVLIVLLRNWSFSKHTVELYGLVWLSVPLSVVFVGVMIRSLSQSRLKNYRRDEIFGLIWKWNDSQESTSDEYLGLTALCPRCFHELGCDVVRDLPEFRCPNCSFSAEMFIEDFHGNPIYGYNRIVKRAHEEKERRIESGEYKKAKQRIKKSRGDERRKS